MNDLYQRGLEIRKAVLGKEYVEKALAGADDFSRPMQELATEYCWGRVWSRPGLERRDRSLINLAMISALNRPHELKIHVKGALTNGITREEICEVFLQVAIYCGMPAGVDLVRPRARPCRSRCRCTLNQESTMVKAHENEQTST
jgi:4-carboxymuconolactone decarboxylase